MISFCKVKLVSFSLTEKLAKHSLGHERARTDRPDMLLMDFSPNPQFVVSCGNSFTTTYQKPFWF
ncbi:hypothetical protein BS586_20245 [Vibrio parahaemolyticus]|nr:hypothetical protein BS586_20245 [Vibrio parahaemolyticus]TOF26497.1 hypothetical protein CGJ28_24910 [Vibrio parahaemolyticus]